MKELPKTKNALVLRVDFSDDAGWDSIRTAIRQPVGEFQAFVDFVSDPAFDGASVEDLLALHSDISDRDFMFVVDKTTFSHSDNPILVIDLIGEPGRTFRVIPSAMWGVENNLSISNMDFADFADHTDAEGIFRDFPEGIY